MRDTRKSINKRDATQIELYHWDHFEENLYKCNYPTPYIPDQDDFDDWLAHHRWFKRLYGKLQGKR